MLQMEKAATIRLDGPVVIVQKGWQSQGSNSISSTKTQSDIMTAPVHRFRTNQTSVPKKCFAFVNSTMPGRSKDSEVRKLIISHVRNEFVRRKRGEITIQKTDNGEPENQAAQPKTLLVSTGKDMPRSVLDFSAPMLFGYPTKASSYPIEVCQATHALLSHYLIYASSRMFPIESCLKSNPLRSPEWLHFAVTDAAMFHAALYAAAVYVALLQGKRESNDAVYHQSQTISIVQ